MHVSPNALSIAVHPPNYSSMFDSMPVYKSHHYIHDLGDLGDIGNTATNIGAQAGGITAGTLALIPAVVAAGPFAPIVGLAAALTGLFGQIFSGCGQTCIISSDDANKVESLLKQNLGAYQSSPRTPVDQAAALANFDYAWSQLLQACGNPALGSAGQRCISERQRGGCAAWQCNCPNHTGGSGNGECCGCDWFVLYRDPIANDVTNNTAASSTSSAPGGLTSTPGAIFGGISMTDLLVGAAAVGLILFSGRRN